MKPQNPVIVIPGITATGLVDDYPLRADVIWSMIFNKQFDRLALHPDDLRYEAIEPAHIVPGSLFPVYDDLIQALRHELSPRADRPTPVYAFPYDWRMTIDTVSAKLADFVEEVLARTRLLKHYAGSESLQVDLVGHSMGGLVIVDYLAKHGKRAPVGRVATIGAPFRGSLEAIVKIATGMSMITGRQPREREREAARVTPSLYQLLPAYPEAVIDEQGAELDIFDPQNMQHSVVSSLAEFVRLFSVTTRAADRHQRAAEILQDFLRAGRQQQQVMNEFRLSNTRLKQSDWLAVVGINEKTRVQMTVQQHRKGPHFHIADEQFLNGLKNHAASWETGDGTVALASAAPPFLSKTRPVCVRDDDIGLAEIRDRLMVEFGGLHALLPRINLVQRLVMGHLRPDYRGDIWGRPLPGQARWNPPIKGLRQAD